MFKIFCHWEIQNKTMWQPCASSAATLLIYLNGSNGKQTKKKLTITNAGEDKEQQELSFIGDGIMKW